ncbi:MAG: T9SS type A sorting domain-containing protein [Candidatus Latescibacteria bacterium]|nr:T9SS type A sorting domain-containing protein [Candidatus Latescibacterota bacterium]
MRRLPLAAGIACLSLCLLSLVPPAARAALPLDLFQSQNPAPHSLLGTEISDLKWSGRYLWVATERGLARLDPSLSKGLSPAEWVTFTQEQGLGRGAVSAVDAVGDTVWAATLFDTTAGASGQVGSGLSFSLDGGQNWNHITNEAIFDDTTRPGFLRGPTTAIDNPCFGVGISGSTVWATYFAGSLVRTSDLGQNWERVLPDGAEEIIYFDRENGPVADSLQAVADSLEGAGGSADQVQALRIQVDDLRAQHLQHRTYAVLTYGDTVWVGTASGIARSFDGGRTWANHKVRHDAQGGLLPGNIAGNWVVALKRQVRPDGRSVIWAGTRSTGLAGEKDAISYSTDNGQTWQITAPTFAWDFAFTGNQVWASTNQGLYASADQGVTWEKVAVRDLATGEELSGVFNGLEAVGQTLWAGAENGLGRSTDEGQTWAVVKSLVRPLSLDRGELVGEAGLVDSLQTYAAPNPFAPSQDEKARIVYSLSKDAQVTIEIYDFASRKVRTLIAGERRAGGQNHASDTWDGRDDEGDPVANGVYFYRVELDSGQETFGKIVVLD